VTLDATARSDTAAPEPGQDLGVLVRAWRERALLTQEQLAGRSGMSIRSIRRLESGQAGRPRSSSIELLATALELSEPERTALIAAARGASARSSVDRNVQADVEADVQADPDAAPSPPPFARDTPRQLPAPPPSFTGRAAELADLDRIPDATSVVITSVDGMAGVGKTALAVHAAHRMAGHYPDGQLFLDLHGHTNGVPPVETGAALDRMLRALGVPGEEIPRHLDDRAALYRSHLAERKVLVLLDNAASEAQVTPLLPATSGCLVVVTSRRRLVGLDQTRVVSLDVLPSRDAVDLFVSAAGADRTAGESPEALAEVVELCGRLPLAVRIAAARLRSRPAWTVGTLADKLRDHRHRLVELEAGHRSVAAALESSYQDLDPAVRRSYRLLGLHPGAELDSYAVAALLDAGTSDASRQVDQLIDAHLLQEPAPGRYSFHDLVRDHARETSAREDTEPDRGAAITRLLDHYRHAASAAMDVAYPHERQRRPDVPPAHTPMPTFPDPARAGAWLGAELPNLVAVAKHAAEHSRSEHALHLAATLHRYLYDHGRAAEAVTLHEHALAAARAAGDGRGEADALVLLAQVHWWFHSRLEQAGELLEHAAATARAAGHRAGEVRALTSLGPVRSLQGAHERAGEHFADAREGARHVSGYVTELDALYALAWHHLWRSVPATDEFEQCRALARAAGDSNGEWLALYGLGNAHRLQGRFERAIDCLDQALQISRTVGDQRGRLGSLIGLAYAHRQEGNDTRAAAYYQQALDLARELGNPNWEYEAVHGLGRVACAAGCAEQALAYFGQALELATRLGQPIGDVRAHDGLAHAHRALGQREDARRHWERALDILLEICLTELGTDVSYGDEVTTAAVRAHLRSL
jgi:tetratricopeptide (TPR) repeat protein/transcriptional regulator with XRE-family HTH domain